MRVFILIVLLPINLIAQSKKIQITVLQQQKDSILNVLSLERTKSELEISKLNSQIDVLSKRVSIIQLECENIKKEKYQELRTLKKVKDSIESLIVPKLLIKCDIVEEAINQDARTGKDDEVFISIFVDNILVESFTEIGEPIFGFSDYENELLIASEMVEKTFSLYPVNKTEFCLIKKSFCSDCDQKYLSYFSLYRINSSKNWDLIYTMSMCDE